MKHNFKNLLVWQKSMDLVTEVYQLTRNFPESERYNLVSQINRSAVSVPSNIAEGSGRNTNKDFARFLGNALGSLYELETQLILAERLKFISQEDSTILMPKVNEIQRMLNKFTQSINSKS
ncbi:four helix bundle protein [Limibacter armeniacum]|uniref:four helix bundle protein n=1 Tax=Limibacter armeniacum TaxID=466084 RepID=UPI002FE5F17E